VNYPKSPEGWKRPSVLPDRQLLPPVLRVRATLGERVCHNILEDTNNVGGSDHMLRLGVHRLTVVEEIGSSETGDGGTEIDAMSLDHTDSKEAKHCDCNSARKRLLPHEKGKGPMQEKDSLDWYVLCPEETYEEERRENIGLVGADDAVGFFVKVLRDVFQLTPDHEGP
jgi:hypothetical protein